jgi:hypothetical protein
MSDGFDEIVAVIEHSRIVFWNQVPRVPCAGMTLSQAHGHSSNACCLDCAPAEFGCASPQAANKGIHNIQVMLQLPRSS